MSAYYNEHDPHAAQWLRNLINAGHIAPGIVDDRDIRDISPDDLTAFTQCHFFAGIGVWSHALRSAGWGDDRPVWSGSCPCQPFSAAGERGGFDDERHLWPAWFHLIEQCRPPIVIGEQVASKDGLGWLDLVSADLEGTGYAFGAADLCAAGAGVEWEDSQAGEWLQRAIHDCDDPAVQWLLDDFADWADRSLAGFGGPHIRQRLYFVGLANANGWNTRAERQQCGGQYGLESSNCGGAERLADSDGGASRGNTGRFYAPEEASRGLRNADRSKPLRATQSERVAHAAGARRGQTGRHTSGDREARAGRSGDWNGDGSADVLSGRLERTAHSDTGNGERQDADWLLCRDGKWRPARPGSFPLADDATARVGRLRAYGNALDAAGHICTLATDLEPQTDDVEQLDALDVVWPADQLIITNPPWTRSVLHRMIDAWPNFWGLWDANWVWTKQARAYLPRCESIVPIGRVRWIPGSKHVGMDDAAWFRFVPHAGAGPRIVVHEES